MNKGSPSDEEMESLAENMALALQIHERHKRNKERLQEDVDEAIGLSTHWSRYWSGYREAKLMQLIREADSQQQQAQFNSAADNSNEEETTPKKRPGSPRSDGEKQRSQSRRLEGNNAAVSPKNAGDHVAFFNDKDLNTSTHSNSTASSKRARSLSPSKKSARPRIPDSINIQQPNSQGVGDEEENEKDDSFSFAPNVQDL